ncbi:phage tail tube protein FII [Ancylobacter sp. 3268]|uniref:phage major tail tube protein n=1 Tax=Ancylobacter sp. 3268 TaxID=2817752 RepID=UPI00285E9FDE|nr:phage major tail tube protein [Ancylobacter sp. 3268]MDR6952678.1 phage tail tube protein FII [Ancylobacter sp. 3268]
MDPIKVGHITNADVYMENNRLTGRVKEFDQGDFEVTTVDHETLGMIGVISLPSRSVAAIKGKISFAWLDHEMARIAMNPTRLVRFSLHSYVDVFGSSGLDTAASHRLVTTMGVHFTKLSGNAHTLGEAVGHEMEISIVSIVQRVSTSEIPLLEYDPFAGVYQINGEPVWPD